MTGHLIHGLALEGGPLFKLHLIFSPYLTENAVRVCYDDQTVVLCSGVMAIYSGNYTKHINAVRRKTAHFVVAAVGTYRYRQA